MYVPRILHGYRPGTAPIRTQASTSAMITGTILPIPYGEFLSPYIDPSSEPAFADLRILGARIRCPLPTGLAPRVRVSRPTADSTTTKYDAQSGLFVIHSCDDLGRTGLTFARFDRVMGY